MTGTIISSCGENKKSVRRGRIFLLRIFTSVCSSIAVMDKTVFLKRQIVFAHRTGIGGNGADAGGAGAGFAFTFGGEKTNRVAAHLERSAGSAVLARIDARSAGFFVHHQFAFDQHFASFGEILIADFGLFAKDRNAEPGGLFFELTRSIGPAPTGRYGKRSHGGAVGRITHLGIASQVPNENKSLIHHILLAALPQLDWVKVSKRL